MHRVPRPQVMTVESPVPANVKLAFELLSAGNGRPKDVYSEKLVEKANEVVLQFLNDNGLSQSISEANARSQMVAVHAAHMAPPPEHFAAMPTMPRHRSLSEAALDTFVSIMVGGGLTFTIAQIVSRQGPEILDAIEKMIEDIRIAHAANDAARDDSASPQFPPLDDPATTPPFNSVQKAAGVGAPVGAD